VPLPPRPPVEHVVAGDCEGDGDGLACPQPGGGLPGLPGEGGGHAFPLFAPAMPRLPMADSTARSNNNDNFFMCAPFNSCGRHRDERSTQDRPLGIPSLVACAYPRRMRWRQVQRCSSDQQQQSSPPSRAATSPLLEFIASGDGVSACCVLCYPKVLGPSWPKVPLRRALPIPF